MNYSIILIAANCIALLSWICLICWPVKIRPYKLFYIMRLGVIALFSYFYIFLIIIALSNPVGGVHSIEAVRALFSTDAGLVAGWLHYLAFDLFVGVYVAEFADRIGVKRIVQVPFLLLVFTFGPIGWISWSIYRKYWFEKRVAK